MLSRLDIGKKAIIFLLNLFSGKPLCTDMPVQQVPLAVREIIVTLLRQILQYTGCQITRINIRCHYIVRSVDPPGHGNYFLFQTHILVHICIVDTICLQRPLIPLSTGSIIRSVPFPRRRRNNLSINIPVQLDPL